MRHANNVLHRLPCGVQGFPLSGKTQHQVVTRVADGGSVANLVNAHKIMVCYDPDDPQDTLFEMWPTHVPEEALNNFRWLKANYTAPDEYKFLFNPKREGDCHQVQGSGRVYDARRDPRFRRQKQASRRRHVATVR